jgi:NAD(P)-dependent dehydrogenase (short-subunit alcohol dehydrogenase family)
VKAHGVAAVTGAGRGLGRAIAIELAARGFDVLATMRNPTAGKDLPDVASDFPGSIRVAPLDVTAPNGFTFPAELTVLVNNAGVRLSYLPVEVASGDSGRDQAGHPDEWRTTFETNVFGLSEMLRRAIPVLRDNGGGVICTITSASILVPMPFFSVYRASKAAASAIMDTLAIEVAPLGIRAVEILPGPIDTELMQSSVMYRAPEAIAYPPYEAMARRSMTDSSTSIVTSPQDAARAIADAILDDEAPLRNGCDPVSRMLLEQWRTSSDEDLLRGMRERFVDGIPQHP